MIEEGEVSKTIRHAIDQLWPKLQQGLTQKKYLGAGTIELLWDLENEEIYFLEMNCRIQVEHTVTELLLKENLVKRQLEVAAQALPPKALFQKKSLGHAIELRLYAEDERQNFLPETGDLDFVHWGQAEHCRWDLNFAQGDSISGFYDPMIAKLIVWGANREVAVQRALVALKDTVIHGVQTNVDFLIDILSSADFQQDQISITWLEKSFLPTRREFQMSEEMLQELRSLAQELSKNDSNTSQQEKKWRLSHRE